MEKIDLLKQMWINAKKKSENISVNILFEQ